MSSQGAESRKITKDVKTIAAENLEHQKLIRVLLSLPDFLAIELWTIEQQRYLASESKRWKWLGRRLDYLQQVQLGFLPIDPATQVLPEMQEHLRTHSNHLFAILQVVVRHFGVIASEAKNQKRPFDFANPREFFAEICKQLSSGCVQAATSRQIGKGETLSEIRTDQIDLGKFYRSSLKKERPNDYVSMRNWLINSEFLEDFVVGVVTGLPAGYLRKSHEWKLFLSSHKELTKYLNSNKNLAAMRWNCGHPVRADTSEPVIFDVRPG